MQQGRKKSEMLLTAVYEEAVGNKAAEKLKLKMSITIKSGTPRQESAQSEERLCITYFDEFNVKCI